MSYLKTYLPYLFGNKKNQMFEIPQSLDWGILTFEETLMFHALTKKLDNLYSTLNLKELVTLQVFHLFNYLNFLSDKNKNHFIKVFNTEWIFYTNSREKNVLTVNQIQELFALKTNDLTVFALMNPDRHLPGNVFIKKANGKFVKNKNGDIWSKKILGLSSRELPFCHTNGSTPTGIYKINSVMPEANHPYEFGANRRLKLDYLEKDFDDNLLVPNNQKQLHWWKQALVAEKLGRSLFRIHGSGRINKNPFRPYFPLVPSSGCLTLTERTFLGFLKLDDQRLLLDSLMESMNLDVSFTNELKIHGLLYVVEFDDSYQALEF